MDFLRLVLIEFFLLGAIAEAVWANINWKSAFRSNGDAGGPKFQVEGSAPPPTILVRKIG